MLDSSLKLGTIPGKEKFYMLVKDHRFWKSLGISLLAGLNAAFTLISGTIMLGAVTGLISNDKYFYAYFALSIGILALFMPLGTFMEFFCAESQNSTMEDFCKESAHLDRVGIKHFNFLSVFIILPLKILCILCLKLRHKLSLVC